MPNTHVVPAQGPVDGTNVRFYVPEPYVPGSTAYILNGKIYSQFAARGGFNPFGFVESDPDTGEIQVDFAPSIGSVVQILYWDRKPTVQAPIEALVGVPDEVDELIGVVSEQRPELIVGILEGGEE